MMIKKHEPPARVAAGLQHRPDAAQRSHRRRRGPPGGL